MVGSDFDFESVNLGLHQEYIELDFFNHGLAKFSDQDFIDAGLTAEDRAFIAFMAAQEIDNATLLTNMLGKAAPNQCIYDYPSLLSVNLSTSTSSSQSGEFHLPSGQPRGRYFASAG